MIVIVVFLAVFKFKVGHVTRYFFPFFHRGVTVTEGGYDGFPRTFTLIHLVVVLAGICGESEPEKISFVHLS